MNNKLLPEELHERIISFLKEHKQASLATCMNNIPRSSPVQYFLGREADIYIMSAGGEKFTAIQQNPNVCLLVNTEYINYRKIKGVQIFGRAETSDQVPELLMEAREFSPDSYLLDSEAGKIKVIKIKPEEIVYLDSIETGDRTKQVLKGEELQLKNEKELARRMASAL